MAKAKRATRAHGSATRTRILENAGVLFAERGFAETPNKAIAAQAAVDLASINYHFGGREGLYQAVLAEAHRRFVSLEELADIGEGDLASSAKLDALFGIFVRRLSQDADWGAAVLAREVLAPSEHLATLLSTEVAPKIGIVLTILSEITGIPVGDSALLCCLVSVAAPFAMLLVTRGQAFPARREIEQMPRQDLADHLRRFALAGLQDAARDYARKQGRQR